MLLLFLPKLNFNFSAYETDSAKGPSNPSSFNLFAVTTCPLSTGYKFCDINEYTYGKATAIATMQLSEPQDINGATQEYMVKQANIKYACDGTKIYVYENRLDFTNLKCDEFGCYDGKQLPSLNGTYSLTSSIKQVSFICWARTDTQGDYSWTWVGRSITSANFKVVNCYQDKDCGIGTCIKDSANYTQWQCSNAAPKMGKINIPIWIWGVLGIGLILFLIYRRK